MIRGVIFDLGNTLMYWDGDGEQIDHQANVALLAFLNRNGIPVEEDFLPHFRAAREDGWRLAEQENIEYTVEQALDTALKQQGYSSLDGILPRAIEEFFKTGERFRHPYPESILSLETLKSHGLHVGLISNADDDGLVQSCVVQLGFAPFLDPVTSSAGLRWRKPNPEIFRYVARLWKIDPNQIAMVGDAPKYDIRGAHLAGMRGILIDRGEGYWWQKIPEDFTGDPEIQPDAVVKSLLEIPDVIARWE